MITINEFTQKAQSFHDVKQHPHHHQIIAFKVRSKIFCTLNPPKNRACIKLSVVDQYTFCQFDESIIYPVPNKFSKHGWTLINLEKINHEMLLDALTAAYCNVAPASLSKLYLNF